MHCDQSYPVFLLYDPVTRRLKSFGWAALANLTSPMWEHPPIPFLSVRMRLFHQKISGAFHSTRPPGKKDGGSWVGKHSKKVWVCRRLLKPWTYFRENPFATLKIRIFMNCGISVTWMHACDREILRLDLEKITRSRNTYNASTQFTIRLRLLIQNDSLFKRPNSQSLYSAWESWPRRPHPFGWCMHLFGRNKEYPTHRVWLTICMKNTVFNWIWATTGVTY